MAKTFLIFADERATVPQFRFTPVEAATPTSNFFYHQTGNSGNNNWRRHQHRNKQKSNNISDMELCIATKSKIETAQSSMPQSSQCSSSSNCRNYQKKCHQNQTNTQVQSTQRSNCSSHSDRDHLTNQQKQQNQRTNSATAASAAAATLSESTRCNIIISSSSSSSTKSSKNIREPSSSSSTQLNTLYSLLVLLIVGLATATASPSPSPSHAPFGRESRRDALLAYYKRAHLPQSSSSGISLGHKYHLLHDANGLDFDELTPTASSVSALSRAERFRLRKRSATPTTPATAAGVTSLDVTTAAAAATDAAAKDAGSGKKPEEKCEPKVLETLPDEPVG